MGFGFGLESTLEPLIAGDAKAQYTVVRRNGCVLVFGAIPIDDFVALAALAGDNSFMSVDAARMSGATFVAGTENNLSALIEHLKPESFQKTVTQLKARGDYRKLSEPAILWLAHGERGKSSEAIFTAVTGVDAGGDEMTPSDVGDFRRCRILLDQCPEIARGFKSKMAGVGQWGSFLGEWDELCRLMDEEVPHWRERPSGKRPWEAPLTYQKMKEIRGETHRLLRAAHQRNKL